LTIAFRFLICKSDIVESNEIKSITIFYISLSLPLSLSLSLSLTGEEGVHTKIQNACTLSVPHSVSQSVSMCDIILIG
jgi:hypothetical protein